MTDDLHELFQALRRELDWAQSVATRAGEVTSLDDRADHYDMAARQVGLMLATGERTRRALYRHLDAVERQRRHAAKSA